MNTNNKVVFKTLLQLVFLCNFIYLCTSQICSSTDGYILPNSYTSTTDQHTGCEFRPISDNSVLFNAGTNVNFGNVGIQRTFTCTGSYCSTSTAVLEIHGNPSNSIYYGLTFVGFGNGFTFTRTSYSNKSITVDSCNVNAKSTAGTAFGISSQAIVNITNCDISASSTNQSAFGIYLLMNAIGSQIRNNTIHDIIGVGQETGNHFIAGIVVATMSDSKTGKVTMDNNKIRNVISKSVNQACAYSPNVMAYGIVDVAGDPQVTNNLIFNITQKIRIRNDN